MIEVTTTIFQTQQILNLTSPHRCMNSNTIFFTNHLRSTITKKKKKNHLGQNLGTILMCYFLGSSSYDSTI